MSEKLTYRLLAGLYAQARAEAAAGQGGDTTAMMRVAERTGMPMEAVAIAVARGAEPLRGPV